MLKEAIEKIEEMSKPLVHAIGNEQYIINSDGHYRQIHPDADCSCEIELHSLDALVQMIKTEALTLCDPPIYVEAKAHDTVCCFLQPCAYLRYRRPALYKVLASDIPGWNADMILEYESALIAVRTRFQMGTDTDYLLRLLSDISNGAKVTYADNGVATTIVTQKGIALQGSEAIRPIITLQPYRTFQEIDQPPSLFHIRISERGIRFIEADGGMWKLTARKSIAQYLTERLSEAVADGKVVVML